MDHRQFKGGGGALPSTLLEPQRCTVLLGNGLADRQSQAAAAAPVTALSIAQSSEACEDALPISRRNARPVVRDRDAPVAAEFAGGDPDDRTVS